MARTALLVLALCALIAMVRANDSRVILSDLSEFETTPSDVVADVTLSEEDDSSACTACQDFVTSVRSQAAASPAWKAALGGNSTCPVHGNFAMCDTWKERSDRQKLIKDMDTGICAHEVCVKQRVCKRNACETCQVLLGPAAYLFTTDKPTMGTWIDSRLKHYCKDRKFKDHHADTLCNVHKVVGAINAVNQLPPTTAAPAAGLAMCQSFGSCDASVTTPWQACQVAVPVVPAVKPNTGCTYKYEFATATKLKMGAMFQKAKKDPKSMKGRSVVATQVDFDLVKLGDTVAGDHVFSLVVNTATVDQGEVKVSMTYVLKENPLYFVQTPAGTITSVLFHPRETLKILNLKRRIVNMFHFKVGTTAEYTTEELSLNGPRVVHYTLREKTASPAAVDLEFDPESLETGAAIHHKVPQTASKPGATPADTIEVTKTGKMTNRDLKALHEKGTLTVDLDKKLGIVKAAYETSSSSTGHMSEDDRVRGSGEKGGMDSFTLRVHQVSKLSLKSSTCGAVTDVQFDSVEDIAAHVGLSGSELIVGDLEADPVPEDDDVYATPVTSDEADAHPQAATLDEYVEMVDPIVRSLAESGDAEQRDELTTALSTMIKNDGTGRVVHRIGEYLYDAGGAASARAALLHGDDHAATRHDLCRVLCDHQDGATLQVVHDVLKSEATSTHDRRLLMHSLLTVAKPTRDLFDHIEEIATTSYDKHDAPVALSVLSAMAGRLPEGHDMRTHVRDLACTKLESAAAVNNEWDQEVALVALGNIGSCEDMDTVTSYLTNPVRELREQAVTSLRRMPGADVDAAIVHQFLVDPNTAVRTAAINALQEREAPRAVWRTLSAKLEAGADGFPPLSRTAAEKLLSALRGHGINAKFIETPNDTAESLDELEAAVDEDTDVGSPVRAARVDYLQWRQGFHAGAAAVAHHALDEGKADIHQRLHLDRMWRQDACDLEGSSFSMEKQKDLSFGAKQFREGIYGNFMTKGITTQTGDYCALVGAEAGNYIEIVGKKFTIFGFRLETYSTPTTRQARPALIVFGFQIAIEPMTLDTSGAETITSVLCNHVTPVDVWPPPPALGIKMPANPMENAPKEGAVKIDMKHWSKFLITAEMRVLGILRFAVGIVLDIRAAAIAEPCQRLGGSRFIVGADPNFRVNVWAEGGVDAQVAGAGVGLDMQVMQGDMVLSAVFDASKDQGRNSCPTASKGVMIHLNWQALAGKFYVFVGLGPLRKAIFAVCFPKKGQGQSIDRAKSGAKSEAGSEAGSSAEVGAERSHPLPRGQGMPSGGACACEACVCPCGGEEIAEIEADYPETGRRLRERCAPLTDADVVQERELYDGDEMIQQDSKGFFKKFGRAIKKGVKGLAMSGHTVVKSVAKVSKNVASFIKNLLKLCEKGTGFFYAGVKPLYGKCKCDSQDVPCPDVPKLKHWRRATFTDKDRDAEQRNAIPWNKTSKRIHDSYTKFKQTYSKAKEIVSTAKGVANTFNENTHKFKKDFTEVSKDNKNLRQEGTEFNRVAGRIQEEMNRIGAMSMRFQRMEREIDASEGYPAPPAEQAPVERTPQRPHPCERHPHPQMCYRPCRNHPHPAACARALIEELEVGDSGAHASEVAAMDAEDEDDEGRVDDNVEDIDNMDEEDAGIEDDSFVDVEDDAEEADADVGSAY